VPGPVIRVKVGDTIRVDLKNPAENQLSHSIDFHASQVAWSDEMRSIAPGEELAYEWTAEYAGIWMYQCGTSPALHDIANGMFGMVIVEPAAGLAPVDNVFALVQSEWYLGPQKEPTDLTKASAIPGTTKLSTRRSFVRREPSCPSTGSRQR
jgi:nitrite reductase (NO-forming)